MNYSKKNEFKPKINPILSLYLIRIAISLIEVIFLIFIPKVILTGHKDISKIFIFYVEMTDGSIEFAAESTSATRYGYTVSFEEYVLSAIIGLSVYMFFRTIIALKRTKKLTQGRILGRYARNFGLYLFVFIVLTIVVSSIPYGAVDGILELLYSFNIAGGAIFMLAVQILTTLIMMVYYITQAQQFKPLNNKKIENFEEWNIDFTLLMILSSLYYTNKYSAVILTHHYFLIPILVIKFILYLIVNQTKIEGELAYPRSLFTTKINTSYDRVKKMISFFPEPYKRDFTLILDELDNGETHNFNLLLLKLFFEYLFRTKYGVIHIVVYFRILYKYNKDVIKSKRNLVKNKTNLPNRLQTSMLELLLRDSQEKMMKGEIISPIYKSLESEVIKRTQDKKNISFRKI